MPMFSRNVVEAGMRRAFDDSTPVQTRGNIINFCLNTFGQHDFEQWETYSHDDYMFLMSTIRLGVETAARKQAEDRDVRGGMNYLHFSLDCARDVGGYSIYDSSTPYIGYYRYKVIVLTALGCLYPTMGGTSHENIAKLAAVVRKHDPYLIRDALMGGIRVSELMDALDNEIDISLFKAVG